MASRIPEFAPGSAHAVAKALKPAIAQAEAFHREHVRGPWAQVLDILHALDWALRLRNLNAIDELSKTAEGIGREAMLKAAGREHRIAGRLLLLVQDTVAGRVSRWPRSQRIDVLANFLERVTPVEAAMRMAVQTLPGVMPELSFTKSASDPVVVGRATANAKWVEEFRDRLSKMNFDAGHLLSHTNERKVGDAAARIVDDLRKRAGDGPAIIVQAARLLGVPEQQIKGLFNHRHQRTRRGKRNARLTLQKTSERH